MPGHGEELGLQAFNVPYWLSPERSRSVVHQFGLLKRGNVAAMSVFGIELGRRESSSDVVKGTQRLLTLSFGG
jgi:hypothetical protein